MNTRAVASVCAVALAACGGGDGPEPPDRPRSTQPVDTTCRELQTKTAARALALRIDHLLVAPDGQARATTVRALAGSLHATCRQPTLPGVGDPLDYRPVRPVVRQLQQEFDEHALDGH